MARSSWLVGLYFSSLRKDNINYVGFLRRIYIVYRNDSNLVYVILKLKWKFLSCLSFTVREEINLIRDFTQ